MKFDPGRTKTLILNKLKKAIEALQVEMQISSLLWLLFLPMTSNKSTLEQETIPSFGGVIEFKIKNWLCYREKGRESRWNRRFATRWSAAGRSEF